MDAQPTPHRWRWPDYNPAIPKSWEHDSLWLLTWGNSFFVWRNTTPCSCMKGYSGFVSVSVSPEIAPDVDGICLMIWLGSVWWSDWGLFDDLFGTTDQQQPSRKQVKSCTILAFTLSFPKIMPYSIVFDFAAKYLANSEIEKSLRDDLTHTSRKQLGDDLTHARKSSCSCPPATIP